MAYNGEFNAVSIFALDNVALNGNAMFSILRNKCGQSVIEEDEVLPCGNKLVMPNMSTSNRLPLVWNIVLFIVYGALVAMVVIMLVQAFRLRNEGPQEHRLGKFVFDRLDFFLSVCEHSLLTTFNFCFPFSL